MRKRTLMVNIEIQALAWALEFVAGNATNATYLIFLFEREKIKKWALLTFPQHLTSLQQKVGIGFDWTSLAPA